MSVESNITYCVARWVGPLSTRCSPSSLAGHRLRCCWPHEPLAFALTFGAAAVAVALSFGLGGREAAGRQMEHWLSKLRRES